MLIDIPSNDLLIEGPTVEPLTLDDVKGHLKFRVSNSEDALIGGPAAVGWIAGARQLFEEETGRQLITATWEYQLDAFPLGPIELPHPPLQRVLSVEHLDIDGNFVPFADTTLSPPVPLYDVQAPSGPSANRGLIRPKYGKYFPYTPRALGAVRVRYVAGYGDTPADVPAVIKSALYMLVGHLFKFRTEDYEAILRVSSISTLSLNARSIVRSFKTMPVFLPQLRQNQYPWSGQ